MKKVLMMVALAVIGVEYSRGLTKLNSELKAYNQTYGLTFGYKF